MTRIDFVLSRVKPREPLWDIGCDHGLLAIKAFQTNLTQEIFFVDPSLGAIQKTFDNLKNFQQHQFPFYLSRGEDLPWSNVSGTVVMMGMGFRTIRSVFEMAIQTAPQGIRYIFGPHTEEEEACLFFKSYLPEIKYIEERGRQRLFLIIDR